MPARPDYEPKLPNRFDVERAAEKSPLPTVARDVLYALARRMQQGSTLILLQHMPSLATLAASAGWSKRHVQRALDYLEQLGIVGRRRPSLHDARTKHARTAYTVHYEVLSELGTGSPKTAMDAQSLGLGPVRRKPRAKESPELGTGSPEAGDTMAHSQYSSETSGQTDLDTVVRFAMDWARRRGAKGTEEWARETVWKLLTRPGAVGQDPLRYVRRVLTTDPHRDRWLPQPPQDTGEGKEGTG